MENFALKLKGCSKEDRKEVIKQAKSVGYKWADEDRFKSSNWVSLRFDSEDMVMWYSRVNKEGIKLCYQMPSDMSNIKEALGVEVPKGTLKSGDVFHLSVGAHKVIYRFSKDKGKDDCYYYSRINSSDDFDTDDWLNYRDYSRSFRKATPEETTKLIEAEHSNGWHWDGKALVEIPEYVEDIESGLITKSIDIYKNKIIPYEQNVVGLFWNPSTREAYETQNVKKQIKPLKRIILNQYEAIEILVDEFEMVHNNGKLLLLPK